MTARLRGRTLRGRELIYTDTVRVGARAARDAASLFTVDASGRREPAARAGVQARDYPFPFAAGLAVCNDAEGMDAGLARALGGFVSELGLELGFAAAAGPRGLGLGAPVGGGLPAAEDADTSVLNDLMAAGWIDAVRDDGRGGRVAPIPGLRVGIGAGAPRWLDAADDAPVFVSDARLLERARFGDNLNFRSTPRLLEAAHAYDWEQWSALPETPTALVARFNSVLQPADGPAIPFKRYRGRFRPTAATFPEQLSSANLDALAAGGGAVVVEAAFGAWALIGGRGGEEGLRAAGEDALDAHVQSCWRDLAARAADGRLLVATPSRLMRWLWLRDRLAFDLTKTAERWVVSVRVAPRPGETRPLRADERDGLALVVPEAAPEVVVEDSGRPLETRRDPDPLRPGAHVVHLPWRPLEWPSL